MNKIAIVRFYDYPADPRVRRQAEALVRAGFEIERIPNFIESRIKTQNHANAAAAKSRAAD